MSGIVYKNNSKKIWLKNLYNNIFSDLALFIIIFLY